MTQDFCVWIFRKLLKSSLECWLACNFLSQFFPFLFEHWTNWGYFCWVRKGISFKVAINYVCQMRVDNICWHLDNFGRNLIRSCSFSRIYISQNFIYLLNLRFFNFKFLFHMESILYSFYTKMIFVLFNNCFCY